MLNVSRKTSLVLITMLASLFVVGVAWAASGSFTDTSISDFNSGTVGSCFVGPSSSDGTNGEVTLAPTMSSTFSTGLPTGWVTQTWRTDGTVLASGGRLTVTNAIVSGTLVSSPTSMEFMAVISDTPSQHAGFSNVIPADLDPPAAFFSRPWNQANLYARTVASTWPGVSTLLGTGYLGDWHRFKIDWTTSGVTYYVDGSPVDTQTVSLGSMKPMFSDDWSGTEDSQPLIAAWVRMSPYSPTSCTYTSRVFDKGDATSWWNNLISTPNLPDGTSASFQVRFGNTPTPDGSWIGPFSPRGGTGINRQEQYMQYEVTLATTDAQFTPAVPAVTISYGDTQTAVTLQSLTGRSVEAEMGLALPAVLILAAAGYVVFRKRQRISS
jgi:hypothetical protein